MTIKITLTAGVTVKEINSRLNSLEGSPWSSQRRPRGGYTWNHRRASGSVNFRTTRTTKSGLKRILITTLGKDEVKLTSELVEWILTYFSDDLQRITLTPSK